MQVEERDKIQIYFVVQGERESLRKNERQRKYVRKREIYIYIYI